LILDLLPRRWKLSEQCLSNNRLQEGLLVKIHSELRAMHPHWIGRVEHWIGRAEHLGRLALAPTTPQPGNCSKLLAMSLFSSSILANLDP
jgi:hypothetical protein